jgi:hypothetical protein
VGNDNCALVNAISGGSPHLHVSPQVGQGVLAIECLSVVSHATNATSIDEELHNDGGTDFHEIVVNFAVLDVVWHLCHARRAEEAFTLCFQLPYLILRLSAEAGGGGLLPFVEDLKSVNQAIKDTQKGGYVKSYRGQMNKGNGADDDGDDNDDVSPPPPAAAHVTKVDANMVPYQLDTLRKCIYRCLCIYVSMYLCIYVSMYLCIYVCIYVSTYLCIYVSCKSVQNLNCNSIPQTDIRSLCSGLGFISVGEATP